MRIIRDLQHVPEALQGAVLAIGNFDGVHRGHQSILAQAKQAAQAAKKPFGVLTFEPHPREFFAPQNPPLRVTSLYEKCRILRDLGVELLVMPRFNAAFSGLSAEAFVGEVLAAQLCVSQVMTGENFCFGKGRGGNCDFLAQESARHGFEYRACSAITQDGQVISTSAIRDALRAGDMALAKQMLGREYAISGHVIAGAKRGRTIGFPTANLRLPKLFQPRYGVYAARLQVAGEAQHYDAIANLGVKPTFGSDQPLLEVHGFVMDRNLYGTRIRVSLLEFIRDEKRFDSAEALREQISQDCDNAKNKLRLIS